MSGLTLHARFFDSDLLYSFRRSPVAIASALVALVLFIGSVGAPWLAPHNPMDLASLDLLDSFKPPLPLPDSDWSHALGTDNQGRDVLSAIMYGARISLLVGFLAVGFAVVVGVAIGLTAGYVGGMLDSLMCS
jgi:peptide/nickel transport system permease protein